MVKTTEAKSSVVSEAASITTSLPLNTFPKAPLATIEQVLDGLVWLRRGAFPQTIFFVRRGDR